MKKQTTVIDTNVLLTDGSALKKIAKETIVLPFIVIKELDKHKTAPGEVGVNARATIKYLDELRQQGNLRDGVKTINKSTVCIVGSDDNSLAPDDQIVKVAETLKNNKANVRLISDDLNVRIKASLCGIPTEGWNGNATVSGADDIYSGLIQVDVSEDLINDIYTNGSIRLGMELHPNEYVLLRSNLNPSRTAIGVVKQFGEVHRVIAEKEIFGVRPRNLDQVCALDALMNRDIPLVSLIGKAGSGKSLLCLAAALDLVLNKREYNKIVVIRPPIPMGKDIGFLPGSIQEKMAAWAGPIIDNLEVLLTNQTKANFEMLVENGLLEVAPPTFIRGRSIAKAIIFLDEAQNLTRTQLKTVVTRVSEGSKLILTGDINQIDDPKLTAIDNGLTHLVEAFKGQELAAHLTLNKCERSTLASIAADLL